MQLSAAAATGQPLLAPGPLQQFTMPFPQHTQHYSSQQFAPTMVISKILSILIIIIRYTQNA